MKDHPYSVDTVRELEARFRASSLFRPMRVRRYEAGQVLDYDVRGVWPERRARVRLDSRTPRRRRLRRAGLSGPDRGHRRARGADRGPRSRPVVRPQGPRPGLGLRPLHPEPPLRDRLPGAVRAPGQPRRGPGRRPVAEIHPPRRGRAVRHGALGRRRPGHARRPGPRELRRDQRVGRRPAVALRGRRQPLRAARLEAGAAGRGPGLAGIPGQADVHAATSWP